jgi:hypothetical protein
MRASPEWAIHMAPNNSEVELKKQFSESTLGCKKLETFTKELEIIQAGLAESADATKAVMRSGRNICNTCESFN